MNPLRLPYGLVLATYLSCLPCTTSAIAAPAVSSSAGSSVQASGGAIGTAPLDTLRKRADSGDAAAQYELAQRYANGQGVSMDRPRAFALYSASAEQGFGPAEYAVAQHYKGLSGERLDPAQSLRYTQRAAEHGHGPAQVDLGFLYLNGSSAVPRDLPRAFQWFSKAASGGSVVAQCMLGDFYSKGLGGAPHDHAEALKWYRRTATSSDRCAPKSQYALYLAYRDGKGVRKDLPTAMTWLHKSAAAGNPQAQRTLGIAHDTGQGVKRDPKLAQFWTLKSREGVAPHDDHVHEDDEVAASGNHGNHAHRHRH
ncbi:tetratricopeptide repeat protein [Paracidovorax citrulli]